MKIRQHEIGVCSWSLESGDAGDLVAKIKALELSLVQIALAPLLLIEERSREAQLKTLRESNVKISAGMIDFPGEDYASIPAIRKTGGFVPDATWDQRCHLTIEAAKLAKHLGVDRISVHVGFIPASSNPGYAKIVSRVAEVADALAPVGVDLLLETGQETATELLQFLNDLHRRNVEVNFDPANMVLYGSGDPMDAVRILGRHIRHVHLKDAIFSDQPRMKWGSEVAFGSGEVRPRRFLDALEAIGYTGPLVIEREAGPDRMEDIRAAIRALTDAA